MNFPKQITPQKQNKQPGIESIMNPRPIYDNPNYMGSGRLKDKVAIITGGDSGIGRAVALAYAKEGANISIVYLNEHEDAKETKRLVEEKGSKCVILSGDIALEEFCQKAADETIKQFGKIDILINNAAQQYTQNSIEDITKEQLEHTFKTNVFSMFYMTKAVMPHFLDGSAIINTASITAYKGHETLIDYASSKGAVVSFTRSLALSLANRNIRVNAVAPGPIWTPLIPSSFDEQKVVQFGSNTSMGRPGQPVEVAEAYVFLAADGASYITGEVIHINGGEIVNG